MLSPFLTELILFVRLECICCLVERKREIMTLFDLLSIEHRAEKTI